MICDFCNEKIVDSQGVQTNTDVCICFTCIKTVNKLMALFPKKKIIPFIKEVKLEVTK